MNVFFIDRETYNKLTSKQFSNEDICKLIYTSGNDNSFKAKADTVSLLTKSYIEYLNNELLNMITTAISRKGYFNYFNTLRNKEQDYIKDEFNSYFKENYSSFNNVKKYYEITILPNSTLLVIMERCALSYIIENKNNFQEFILSCLRYQYKFDLSGFLLRTYINIRLNGSFFDLLKSRFA